MKELDITAREKDGVSILEIKGEVDIYSGECLKEKIEALARDKAYILLNISSIGYIDSFGLSLLISLRKRMSKEGKVLCLCAPQSYVRRILNLTQLYDFLAVYEDEDDAVEGMLKNGSAMSLEMEPTISIHSDERRV